MADRASPTERHPAVASAVVRCFGDVEALRGVDCELRRGEITVLMGENGSGKTTLLRLFSGHLTADSGEIRLFGSTAPTSGLSRAQRQRVGYLSQHPALDPEMTASETLHLMAGLFGFRSSELRERSAAVAETFGLGDLLRRRISTFSGGQRRRLHLAAGLLHDPELLLLDEPSAGVDSAGVETLWQELQRRADKGCAVAVVTHDRTAAERYAQRALVLGAGRLVATGAPRRVLAEQALSLGSQSSGGEPGQGRAGGGRGRGLRGVGGGGQGKGRR